ncbi:MAG: YhdP family protein, partial [Gammaproteobacteria bacterium]
PFEIDRLQVQAYTSLVDDGLVVSVPRFEVANTDIRLVGRMRMETDRAGAPFLYLRAQFEDGKGSSNGKYLPLKLLPEKVVAWLDQGIRKIDISAGELLFHGRTDGIKSFSERNAGEMFVDFDIDNAEILFDPKWAPARQAKGRVMFHNAGMEIELEQVKFGEIDSGKGRIKIADLANAVVEVDIETSTNTAKALQTWFSVPLGRKQAFLGGYLRDIEGTVRAKLDLSISVNERGAKNSVDVKLNFDQAAFKAPAWGVELSGIDGEVRVTEKGVSSEGINAFYFKDPVDFTIGSTAENRQTIVLANGQMDSQKVLNRLPEFLARGFEGRSPWQIRLAIANQQDSQRLPVVQIRATSKLEKTQVSFPEPFSKKAEIQRDFSAELSIFEADDIDFKVDFGSDIKARGRLHSDKRGEYRLVAMDIGFSAPLKEPVPRGLRLYGSMPRLALDGWLEFRKAIVASQPGDSTSLTDLLESADLEVQSVSFFGHNFNDADFLLVRTPLGFAGTLDSSLVKGNYEIPFSYSAENPVTADLEYIKFRTLEPKSESSGVLPTDLFDLQLRSKVFEYNDVLFTDLILNARLEGDTLVIDSMELRRNDLTLKLSANWQYLLGVNEHFTTLQVSIKGKEFGQTIASLDLGDIIYGGEVDIEGRAGWSGELLRVDWGSLIGEARFDVVDGVLKDVEPGSGRLVGLLSLSALPRRLLLDFGDIVVDGLQFDKLAGTFKIDQGNLYTNDTSMNGPSARVNISGRTGLLDRDYDQTMIIVPKIRQTLPVIGSLAWGNAAGWGLLILQKLFKKQIDKSVEIEYKVTGTWDEPVLELIREFEEDKPGKKIEGTDK